MGKYTLKQIYDMSLGEAITATNTPGFELVPSKVPGEDDEVRSKLGADLLEMEWKINGQ